MCITISKQDALSERLFHAAIATLELYGVYIGKELGLYNALSWHDSLNALELAEKTGVNSRYAREWLEQQAVAGFIMLDENDADPYKRRFRLPADHQGALADDDHADHLAPFAHMMVGVAKALPDVVKAYRSGEGVPYEKFGKDFRLGQGGINKPAFLHDLVEKWLPAIPDLHKKLQTKEGARIADIGCGEGWSTIALAHAYPNAVVTGYDLDRLSIEDARKNALLNGISANFVHADAKNIAEKDAFDLILILETLHDMSQPTQTLAALRKTLAPGGSVVIADERVAEEFFAPGDHIERIMYGWSIVHCLPVSMADKPSEAIGTVIRPDIVKRCAENAGFSKFEILPIENELFRFYRLFK